MRKSEFQSRRAEYKGKANSEEPLFFKGVSFSVTSRCYVYRGADGCSSKEVCVTYKNKTINKKIQRIVSVEVGKSIKKGEVYPFFEIKYQNPDGSITTKFKYPSLSEQENYQRYLESISNKCLHDY